MTRMGRLLCFGEALIDVVESDGTRQAHVGGSVLNVACGLAALGHRTALASWLARDDYGKQIRQYLRQANVRLTPGSDSANFTSYALAKIAADGHADYEFVIDWAPNSVPEFWLGVCDCGKKESCKRALHLHIGSYSAFLSPGSEQVLAAAQEAAAKDITISFDPNIRASVIGSAQQARQRCLELVKLSTVVKASDEDLAWLYPGRDIADVATEWLALGPKLIAVTRGDMGALLFAAQFVEPNTALIPSEKVVDTIGAGDSFMAGLISGLVDLELLAFGRNETAWQQISTDQLLSACLRGAATAAITVSHPGTYAPTREELTVE